MGLFSGAKSVKFNVPEAAKYKQASELFSSATNWAKSTTPYAYGARESALADLAKGTDYYSSFQPTSLEQALADKNFARTSEAVKQGLSLSGMEYSPVLASSLGSAATDIGEVLANLGNQRAQYSLASRLGIDPYSTYGNYLSTDISQSNLQSQADYQNRLMQAQNEYQNALAKAQSQSALGGSLGSLGGAALSLGLAPFTGGASLALLPMATSLGGSLGSSTSGSGGAGSPLGFGDALSMTDMSKIAKMFGGGSSGSAQNVNASGSGGISSGILSALGGYNLGGLNLEDTNGS